MTVAKISLTLDKKERHFAVPSKTFLWPPRSHRLIPFLGNSPLQLKSTEMAVEERQPQIVHQRHCNWFFVLPADGGGKEMQGTRRAGGKKKASPAFSIKF